MLFCGLGRISCEDAYEKHTSDRATCLAHLRDSGAYQYFEIFALDVPALNSKDGASRAELDRAMHGHIVGKEYRKVRAEMMSWARSRECEWGGRLAPRIQGFQL